MSHQIPHLEDRFALLSLDQAHHQQAISEQVVDGVPQFCGTTCTFVRNAGEVSIDGLEIEGTFRATEALTLRTAIGMLDSGYDKFEYDGQDVAAAAQLNFAPDYTASLSWEYVTEFSSGELVFAGTFSCLLYTSPSPRDATLSRMPSSA